MTARCELSSTASTRSRLRRQVGSLSDPKAMAWCWSGKRELNCPTSARAREGTRDRNQGALEIGGSMTSDAEPSPSALTSWTLRAIKQRNLVLEGHCQNDGCGHF